MKTGLPADPDTPSETLTRRIHASTLVTILIVGVLLNVGRTVFLPLAVATLITFALSPAVARIRALGLPQIASVLSVVTLAFAAIGLFFFVVATQFTVLAAELPTFQANIMTKLERLQSAGDGSNLISRVADMLTRISTEVSSTLSSTATGNAAGGGPVMVEVIDSQNPLQALLSVVLALVSPIATAGLIIIVVIFMLLEREDLRDRFIRLVGSNDLHRTTEMLHDAGSRVATYLLIQLLVNVVYAVPIGLGLWLIGVPNPLLWALLTLVLRFVPYIGSALSAILPIALAFAVSPGWSMVLWTVALFVLVELVTSNLIEPWLYGSRTGLSPLAVIVSAIIWAFIWGPLGLILSTPLTVCLVVLGRYLPQFEVFDIIFGDEPVLAPHARLYQRLLAGDVVESAARAEDELEEAYVADYYQEVGIPALLLAQNDYDRGVLNQAQSVTVANTAAALITGIEPAVDDEIATLKNGDTPPTDADAGPVFDGISLFVAGGRGRLDDASSAMLGQALRAEGAEVKVLLRADLGSAHTVLPAGNAAFSHRCLILCYLDPQPPRGGLLVIRRLKQADPGLRVGVVFWDLPKSLYDTREMTVPSLRLGKAAVALATEIGADFVVRTIADAIDAAARHEEAKPLPATIAKKPRGAHRQQALRHLE